MRRIAIAAIVLALNIPRLDAAELWDFIKVGKNFEKGPKWDAKNGKAAVEISNGRIEIRIAYAASVKPDALDKLGSESIKITGTLGPDQIIRATCTFLNTDTRPVKLTGRYTARDELQIWDDKRKIVTQREIVFSYPSNAEFFGLLKQDIRDE
jgi:hypothetical protein